MLKVMITESRPEICKALKEIIETQDNMAVVGVADCPSNARKMIKALNPDVLILAIEFPQMNGLDFLDKIMKLRPMPVIIVSKLADPGSLISEQAIRLGATACIFRPLDVNIIATELIQNLRHSAAIFQESLERSRQRELITTTGKSNQDNAISSKYVIAIGASTGGTEAITALLKSLPKETPGIVIAQHMPSGFTCSFATRLSSLCALHVTEAKDGELIKQGHAYIAPGDVHLVVEKRSGAYYTVLQDSPPVNLHKPSVDVLFNSVAEHTRRLAIGVLLTGMGKDGATGLLKLKNAGAQTFAQDEQSCVVYGMPKAAKQLGAVNSVLALDKIGPAILEYVNKKK